MHRKIAAIIARAAGSLPVFGPVAEAAASLAESFGELGDSIAEARKKESRPLFKLGGKTNSRSFLEPWNREHEPQHKQ